MVDGLKSISKSKVDREVYGQKLEQWFAIYPLCRGSYPKGTGQSA